MGIDFEDVFYRIEKQFGVRIEPEDFFDEWVASGNDCTAGRLHEIICEKCELLEIQVPKSSWTRMRLLLARTLGCPIKEIHRNAWLRRDLGFD